LQPLLLC
jgi:hypothetical protein